MCNLIIFANFVGLIKDFYKVSVLDIILLVVVLVAAIYGYYKGVVSQIGALAGIVIGIVSCRLFADDLTSFFNGLFIDSTSTNSSAKFLNSIISLVVLFLVGYLGARWMASLLSTVLKKIKLGTINRVIGAIFAIVQGLLILSLALNLWIAIFPNSKAFASSVEGIEERVINLAPDILGSDTAKEFLETANDLAK